MKSVATFKKNIQKFSAIQPTVALEIASADAEHLSFCETKSGELNLSERSNGKEQYFHSNYNPKKEAEKWFSSLDTSGVDVLYVYGLGLGYYYDAAKKWLDEEASRYLVYLEDDPGVIQRFLETEYASEILDNKQVQIHYLKDLSKDDQMFQWMSWYFVLLPIDVSSLLYYQKKKEKKFLQLRGRLMHDSVRKDSLAAEFMRFSGGFFQNFYSNLLLLPKSHHGNKLFGQFNNVPAIICGAGPSLDKNIDVLKTLEDKALIFAGGSALNALNKGGVVPHFGAGIDPNPPQFHRLKNSSSFELPFFYRGRMFHDAFRLVHGPRLYLNGTGGYFISQFFEDRLGIEGDIIDEGHNVVNFSVEIANALGCNPIIFAGMDLAYTGMQSYAGGIVKDTAVTEKGLLSHTGMDGGAFIRNDIHGKPVHTVWKWATEADWIGEYAKEHPERTFVNATEGGIGFPGVVNDTLKNVAEKHMPIERDLKQRVHLEVENASLPDVTMDKLLDLINEMKGSLGRCVDSCDGILEEIDEVKDRLERGKKVQSNLQTGKAALHEVELTEEIAYEYILASMGTASAKIMERQYHQINWDKTLKSDLQRNLKKLEVNGNKVKFLRKAADMNRNIIDVCLKKFNLLGAANTKKVEA
ncbi:Uncharacterized protein SCG7109_AA_00020 [Chlamydiales bacterium SCGC AG-110-M15]|nr:Uncharacterized protein SCG7109_AA_00020 [Chlamydiales bacterium SCGC AG-110-M15]